MKNLMQLYKIMLRYWGYMITGFFLMLGFGALSVVTITMAVPLFDYVFGAREVAPVITTYSRFYEQLSQIISGIFAQAGGLLNFMRAADKSILTDMLKELMSQTDPLLLLYIISWTLLGITIIKNIFFYLNKIMFANLRGRSILDIRDLMFEHYLKQSLAFFNRNKVGDSIVRMVSDVDIVSEQMLLPTFEIIRNIILLFAYGYAAAKVNAKLFFFTLFVLPLFSFCLTLLGKKIKKYAKRLQLKFSDMFSNIEEVLNSMRIVKAFSREENELAKFRALNKKYFHFWRKSVLYSAVNVPLSELNGMFIAIVVILLGGKLVLANNNFTQGIFLFFIGAIFSMLHPIKELTKAYANIKKAQVSLSRILVILNQKSEIQNAINPVRKKDFEDKILFKDVNFGYNDNNHVLYDINLEIKKGEKVAFVGSSGSGKTTLVNLLPRMYDVKSGEIIIDTVNIKQIELKDLRMLFGTVTQDSILFSDTIGNNIRYGSLEEVTQDVIEEAARVSYADEFINNLPKKYNEPLHQRAGNLSGGQKQRLCIARAIVSNPPILIFDEATSALDTEAEKNVQIAIDQATKNRTVLIIAHRLSTVLSADKIVVMDKGRIVGVGKHKDLLQTCERYKVLYNLQFADSLNDSNGV